MDHRAGRCSNDVTVASESIKCTGGPLWSPREAGAAGADDQWQGPLVSAPTIRRPYASQEKWPSVAGRTISVVVVAVNATQGQGRPASKSQCQCQAPVSPVANSPSVRAPRAPVTRPRTRASYLHLTSPHYITRIIAAKVGAMLRPCGTCAHAEVLRTDVLALANSSGS